MSGRKYKFTNECILTWKRQKVDRSTAIFRVGYVPDHYRLNKALRFNLSETSEIFYKLSKKGIVYWSEFQEAMEESHVLPDEVFHGDLFFFPEDLTCDTYILNKVWRKEKQVIYSLYIFFPSP